MSDSTGTNPVVDDIPLESVEQGNTLDGDIETNESTESRFFSKGRNAIILSALAGVGVFAASYLSWFADDSATEKNIIAGRLGYEHPERVLVAPGHSICWLPDTGMQPVEVSGFNKTHFFVGSDSFELETDMVCTRGPRIDDTSRHLDETTATTCQDSVEAESNCVYMGEVVSLTGELDTIHMMLQPQFDHWRHHHDRDYYRKGLYSVPRGGWAILNGKGRTHGVKERVRCRLTLDGKAQTNDGEVSAVTGEFSFCAVQSYCEEEAIAVYRICSNNVAVCDYGICESSSRIPFLPYDPYDP